MTVAVVTPWVDSGDPYRRAAFEFVDAYWRELLPDAARVVGGCVPFDFGRSMNDLIRGVEADVIIHAEADSLLPAAAVTEALAIAARDDGLVVPFDRWLHLEPEPSQVILAGGGLPTDDPACEATGPGGVGNVTVYSRATWEAVGGYDERFGVWGGADGAYAFSCHALVGPGARLHGPVYHLWHPRPPESATTHPHYVSQFTLLAEYRDAAHDPAAIRALIESRDGR